MKHVYQVLNLIAYVKGTNEKIAILKDIKNYPELEVNFLRVVSATFNPYINFYIKKFDLTSSGTQSVTSDEALEVLRVLATREKTGNAAKALLEQLGNSLTKEDQKVLNQIISKKFNNGISVTSINKVWPGHIPVFNVMLCQPLNERSIKEIKFPCYVQVKYDAARVTVVVSNNVVRYFTRNGKEYLIRNPELDKQFLDMATSYDTVGASCVFDGELYRKGFNRVKSNAIATKLVRDTASADDHKNVSIVLWDVIPLDHFTAGKSNLEYYKRLADLRELQNTVNSDYVTVADTKTFEDLYSIREYNAKLIADGEEGVVIKNTKGLWEAKRSYYNIKMKEELESELVVLDVAEGNNKYVGMCGALQCASSDGLVTVSVGTGLTDALREQWKPANKADIVGSIITVRHNGIIQDTHGAYSLYLPRFIEVRFDKNEADDLIKIQTEGK